MLEKINFTYEESADRTNMISDFHTKFDCMIKYNGKQFSFPYQCNTKHMMPTLNDCMDCLLLDASAYTMDFEDFVCEFGYSLDDKFQKNRAKKVYKDCLRAYKGLNRLFTDEELTMIEEEINQ